MQTARAADQPLADSEVLEGRDDDALIAHYVQADPYGFGPDRARVVVGNAAVPVWALIGHLRGGADLRQTSSDFALPEEVVVAAVAYYHRHQSVIDARLTLNDAFFEP